MLKSTRSRKNSKGLNTMKGDKGKKRKQELLEIAYRLFIQKGYEKTSIDEIIKEAKIAKGTYYYYFPSKEATLEAVIDMMINKEVEKAQSVLKEPLSVPQKLVGIITALRPDPEENIISDTLNHPENIVMHRKVNQRVIEEAVPLLSKVITEGIEQGIFNCNFIEERIRMILTMSNALFDTQSFTEGDIIVFIDMVEKSLGAQTGSLEFIRDLIGERQDE